VGVKPYLQDPDVTIYCGDALEVLRELSDESVDCCVTSPPYLDARPEYPSPTLEEFASIFTELDRVLTNCCIVNVGRIWRKGIEQLWWTELLGAARGAGWYLLDTRIWLKPNANPIHGEVFADSHEYVFVLGRAGDRLNEDALRRPHAESTRARFGRAWTNHKGVKEPITSKARKQRAVPNPVGARPRSYFAAVVGREKGNRHPAPMPLDVAKELVLLASFPGQTVIDPFAGSGTTGVACRVLGRDALLIDSKPDYCEMSAKRLAQLSLLSDESESAAAPPAKPGPVPYDTFPEGF
jgi:DNA modification methylase